MAADGLIGRDTAVSFRGTYIDGSGAISQTEVVYDACLVEKGEISNVINSVEFGWIHLGQGIEWNLADLSQQCGWVIGAEEGYEEKRTSPPEAITTSPRSSSSLTTQTAR